MMRSLTADRPDLVHSNDLTTHQLISDAAGRLGLPRMCHHRWVFEREAIDWLNKFGAERHLFVSMALRDQLCGESVKLRNDPGAVVYDGLPLPDVPAERDRAAAKAELGIAEGKSLVLFAGQIIERKGVADLLHGWAELAPRWSPQAELCVVGDDLAGEGAYRREMEQLAKTLAAPVRFLGFQKNVDRWLAASDVVMVPSHVEPLGNATLEAMAQARPVIGGDAGGIPEMVVHEETGLLVPPKTPAGIAAALAWLLADAALRQRMGTAARRRCEELFSIDAHVRAVETEYSRVLRIATDCVTG
jgi:glycosyltransferase involved in cell wall biosynthesis